MNMLSPVILAAAPDLVNLKIADAGILALLGYATVFFGIVALMVVIMIIGKIFIAKANKAAAAAPAAAPAAPVEAPVAPGTAGQLKTYDVPPKTCAMLMAIVADKMGKPLNELRFISIKEVN